MSGSAPAILRQRASELPLPVTKAAHGPIRVDSAGHLWVAEYAHPLRSPRGWSVFTGEGQWLGQVSMPEHFRVLELGADYVLGVYRDELEVEYVQMYGLIKSGT